MTQLTTQTNMTEIKKTPWKKNIDPRYISGEDLMIERNGLQKEMVVTIAKFTDSPTFDQKKQEETDKTAIWLKDYKTGKMLYKPVILNVTNGEFLSNEIGGGSLYIDDFDTTKPFVMYPKPDKRHGFVVRFKKYYAPQISDANAITILSLATTQDELKEKWLSLSVAERNIASVIAFKDELKAKL